MKFISRDPNAGYLDNWLWLPKKHYHKAQIASQFTYVGKTGELIEAWRDEPHHFRVPRNYLLPETLHKLSFQVYDNRPTRFPRVDLRSKAILDAREPSKDYQRRGSEALLAGGDCLLCLRCGAGKTVVSLHSAAQLKVPVLITVTDKGLAEQWIEEIQEFLGVPRSEIGYVGNGKFDWRHTITVAQVSTLARRNEEERLPLEMLFHFGIVICDEAHVMGAPYFNSAIPPFRGVRWGLSATPEREDGFDSLLSWTLGQVRYSYLVPDLVPEFIFKQLPTTLNTTDPVIKEGTHGKNGEFHYGMTYGFLARSNKDRRTDHIVQDISAALEAGRQVLVLAHSKEMTELLGQRFPNAGVVNGSVGGKIRRQRIRECNPVIAIMLLGKQALNKPGLDTLFIVEPFAKKGILQQTMGRILRIFSNKKKPIVVVYDDINIPQLHRLCSKMRFLLTRWPPSKGGKIKYTTKKI